MVGQVAGQVAGQEANKAIAKNRTDYSIRCRAGV
jgi:hypothetical protein